MDWSVKKLGDLVTFERGLTYSKDAEVDFSSKGVLRSNNVDLDTNSLNLDEIKYLNESFSIPSSKKVVKNSLLMCMSNGSKSHLGKVAIIEEDLGYAFGGFMGLLTPNQEVFPRFLYYYLISPEYKRYIQGLSDGANINNLKYKDLSVFPIALPSSISEQKRIVDILDAEFAKIDALKENAEKNLQNAKDLFQAVLRKELEPKEGWKRYKLQDVCTEYGDYGMSLPSRAYNGVRYLRITDITEWGGLNGDLVSADTEFVEDKYILRDGDVLFARTGATVGKTLVYDDSMGSCSYAGYLIRYRPNPKVILPKLIFYITHSKEYYNWIASNQKSATLPNISAKLYNSYQLNLPNVNDQESIVSRLDIFIEKCKTLEENYNKTIILCADLKQALLRKAFNGEL